MFVPDRCHREIAEVLEGRADASFEDRHAMPYVQATIHEAQRMSDTVPLSVFHTTCSDTQLHSYQLPQVSITMTTDILPVDDLRTIKVSWATVRVVMIGAVSAFSVPLRLSFSPLIHLSLVCSRARR